MSPRTFDIFYREEKNENEYKRIEAAGRPVDLPVS